MFIFDTLPARLTLKQVHKPGVIGPARPAHESDNMFSQGELLPPFPLGEIPSSWLLGNQLPPLLLLLTSHCHRSFLPSLASTPPPSATTPTFSAFAFSRPLPPSSSHCITPISCFWTQSHLSSSAPHSFLPMSRILPPPHPASALRYFWFLKYLVE